MYSTGLLAVLLQWSVFILTFTLSQSKNYSMYVWRDGWDPSTLGCNSEAKFLEWSDPNCFTHTWNTAAKREWLWSTCTRPGREVSEIYLYDTAAALSTRDCNNARVQLIKQTLTEGRQRVPGLAIYALFSDGGDAVPEKNHVPHVVWYNTVCTAGQNERFDGVAVNNENWKNNWGSAQMISYLDNLNGIKIEADKQNPPGSLKTHFSVGWGWGKLDNGQTININWKGKNQAVMRHFIDIFTQMDVQVAFVTAEAMESRLRGAELDYANQQGKPTSVNVYINKALPCQTTFFPFAENELDCPAWSRSYKSESPMFEQLDMLSSKIPGNRINLHHFRGAYSSGGHLDWPRH